MIDMINAPEKPRLALLSAARGSNINYKVYWTSEPYLIGKTYWVHVLYYCVIDERFYTGYHFHNPQFNSCFPCDEWKKEKEHPKYNFNDGTYAGLPKSLGKLWEMTKSFTEQVCECRDKDKGIELINSFNNKTEQLSLF